MIAENRRENLAWVAGFFDGEGYAGDNTNRNGRWTQSTVTIRQKEDVPLRKVKEIIGFGRIQGPYFKNGDERYPYYQYAVGAFEHVQAFAAMIWTWLGPAKRAQFRKILTRKGRRPAPMKARGLFCYCGLPMKAKGFCQKHYESDKYWNRGGREAEIAARRFHAARTDSHQSKKGSKRR